MWQLKVNLWIYSFAYYLSRGPIQALEKDNAEAFGGGEQGTVGGIPLDWFPHFVAVGAVMVGYLQDRLGSRFALNLSQLASFLIYLLGFAFVVQQQGGNAKTYLAQYQLLKYVKLFPLDALVAIKLLTMLQHTMQISGAAVAALLPFESSATFLMTLAELVGWYYLGKVGSATLLSVVELDNGEKLLICILVAFSAWLLNHITFPQRRSATTTVALRTGKKEAAKKKPQGDERALDAVLYDTAPFPVIALRHGPVFALLSLSRLSRVYFVDLVATKTDYNAVTGLLAQGVGLVVPADVAMSLGKNLCLCSIAACVLVYLVIPKVLNKFLWSLAFASFLALTSILCPEALPADLAADLAVYFLAVPFLLNIFPSPAALLRSSLVAEAMILAILFVPEVQWPLNTIPYAKVGLVVAAGCLKRLLYVVPTATVLGSMIPGTVGQGVAVFACQATSMTNDAPKILKFALEHIEHKLLPTEELEKVALTIGIIALIFLLSLLVNFKRPILNKKK